MNLDKISEFMPLLCQAMEDAKVSKTEKEFNDSLLMMLQQTTGILQALSEEPHSEAVILQKMKDKGLLNVTIN